MGSCKTRSGVAAGGDIDISCMIQGKRRESRKSRVKAGVGIVAQAGRKSKTIGAGKTRHENRRRNAPACWCGAAAGKRRRMGYASQEKVSHAVHPNSVNGIASGATSKVAAVK